MDLSCRVPVCAGKGGHLCRLTAPCPRIESYKSTPPSVPHFMRVPSASLLMNTYLLNCVSFPILRTTRRQREQIGDEKRENKKKKGRAGLGKGEGWGGKLIFCFHLSRSQ